MKACIKILAESWKKSNVALGREESGRKRAGSPRQPNRPRVEEERREERMCHQSAPPACHCLAGRKKANPKISQLLPLRTTSSLSLIVRASLSHSLDGIKREKKQGRREERKKKKKNEVRASP